MKLTENLTLLEATKSNTATRLGIDNTPPPAIVERMIETAEKIFQPLRDALGPIRVSSFYRSPDLNRAIGGSKTSQHCKGEAIDMQGILASNKMLFNSACDLEDFDQIIWEFGTLEEPDWVHVSYSKTHNRKQILRATKIGKRTAYVPWKKQ
jgi:zinc D-Ala-D-Ala carboxypeptidase